MGKKAVYLLRRGAVRALMGPRKASPLRSRKAPPPLSPGHSVGSEGWVPAPLVFFSPPGSCSLQITTRLQKHEQMNLLRAFLLICYPATPREPLPRLASAPRPPAAGFSVFWGAAAAVPLLPVTGQRAELGQLERPPPTPGSHTQPGPVTVVPHGPRNLCFWLQAR